MGSRLNENATAANRPQLILTVGNAAPALSDVTGSYEWSLDLATWHPDTTTTVGETTVPLSATNDSGTTGSITPPVTLFLRAVATQN